MFQRDFPLFSSLWLSLLHNPGAIYVVCFNFDVENPFEGFPLALSDWWWVIYKKLLSY